MAPAVPGPFRRSDSDPTAAAGAIGDGRRKQVQATDTETRTRPPLPVGGLANRRHRVATVTLAQNLVIRL